MKIDYDREEDILTIELHTSAPIDHAEQVGSLILHGDSLSLSLLSIFPRLCPGRY